MQAHEERRLDAEPVEDLAQALGAFHRNVDVHAVHQRQRRQVPVFAPRVVRAGDHLVARGQQRAILGFDGRPGEAEARRRRAHRTTPASCCSRLARSGKFTSPPMPLLWYTTILPSPTADARPWWIAAP